MSFNSDQFNTAYSSNDPMSGRLSNAGCSILRVVMLFGSAALALALIVFPILNSQADKVASESVFPAGIDRTMTGSIKRDTTNIVKTSSKAPVCIIEVDGRHNGACD